ncbi:hypothetical protein AVEN_252998-1 [Araneus ventricosus]|uniref:Uncharacterized protein n=1 Tax=Araneus ventricosus TaxID=182803 RepID=A0A4Y2EYF3_ARAVE|nr:hypothetical protein AVEN_252998-1 [Araneus ventricosus]
MAFLAKAQNFDLLRLSSEVGLDVSRNVSTLELVKLIQSSSEFEQDTFKDILKAVTSARIKKEEEEKEYVARKKGGERELVAKEREKERGKEKEDREFAAKEKEKEREKEREQKLLLKKMELEIEERRIELTTGERVKSSFDVHHLIQKFDPKLWNISLYLALLEWQVKRAKIFEELWVSSWVYFPATWPN